MTDERNKAAWYFHSENDHVVLRARFEGDDGMIGDAVDIVRPGMSLEGVTYEMLRAAGAGKLVYRRGRLRVVS
jgi:hypothetical protein